MAKLCPEVTFDIMLEAIITSKTRIKLLLKFFLNPSTSAYLRGLASEFGESSNAVRLELNRLEEAGMLEASADGNKKIYQVNKKHPLFGAVQQIVMKYVGIDEIINNVVRGLGNLELVYMGGDLARGMDSNIIEIVLVGNIDRQYLSTTVEKAEKLAKKKISYLIYTPEEAARITFDNKEYFLIWSK